MKSLATMFGLPGTALGHLTSSGTIANLEALWVARELGARGRLSPRSEAAHYTHGRMCQVLGVESRAVPAGPDGRIDLDAVEAQARARRRRHRRAHPGNDRPRARSTTIRAALSSSEAHGFRLHVDGAYGGFFALLGEHGA